MTPSPPHLPPAVRDFAVREGDQRYRETPALRHSATPCLGPRAPSIVGWNAKRLILTLPVFASSPDPRSTTFTQATGVATGNVGVYYQTLIEASKVVTPAIVWSARRVWMSGDSWDELVEEFELDPKSFLFFALLDCLGMIALGETLVCALDCNSGSSHEIAPLHLLSDSERADLARCLTYTTDAVVVLEGKEASERDALRETWR